MDGQVPAECCYVFDSCRLDPVSRTLTRDGQTAKLHGQPFDVLLYLVRNAGRVVAREELMRAIWTTRTVDEGSVSRAISSVRLALKGLGVEATLIHTVAGRGYCFSARLRREPFEDGAAGASAAPPEAGPSWPEGRGGERAADAQAGAARGAARAGEARGAAGRRRLAAVLGTVVALALAGAAWRHWKAAPAPAPMAAETDPAPPPHSIAVLPFTNASGDPAQDYLSDGLSLELTNALGRVSGLRVAASTSSSMFKGRHVLIGDIGRQLHVAHVLEGSVTRDGTRLHVTTQLIDTSTGFQEWSRQYDSDPAGLLAVEDHIASALVTALKGVAGEADLASLVVGRTANARAFDAYLVGMAAVGEPNGAGNRQAIAALGQAIALDPTYSDAYVARARARVYDVVGDSTLAPAAATALLAAAVQDAERAVALAPRLGAAHAALGLALKYQLSDLRRAAAEYDLALKLAPDDAETAMSDAYFQLELGHTAQAVATARHAAALDSLRAMNYRTLAVILSAAHRDEEAMAALAHARALPPAQPGPDRIALGLVLTAKGDAQAARAACAGGLDYYDLACLALADHALGREAEADAAFAKLQTLLGDAGAYVYAGILATRGQTAAATRWLQRAYELRDPGLADIKIDNRLSALRGSPVYQDIVRRIGFPE
jgi:serine/threonine-protein kinase